MRRAPESGERGAGAGAPALHFVTHGRRGIG
jgi:hypothetical protein